MTWGQVADRLAPSLTVICPDLPGFGQSYIPPDAPDSRHSSKREKAAVLVELMGRLGYDRFSVVGHDRGSYPAFRMAMDWPAAVQRLIVVDCLPILKHLERADWKFARDWYHWFFFAQPEKPERASGRGSDVPGIDRKIAPADCSRATGGVPVTAVAIVIVVVVPVSVEPASMRNGFDIDGTGNVFRR